MEKERLQMEKMERKGAAGVKVGEEESRYNFFPLDPFRRPGKVGLPPKRKPPKHLGKRRGESLSGTQVAGQTFAKRKPLAGKICLFGLVGEDSREAF